MTSQHLSDEAVAAFADGVLTGHARARAMRHTAECAECDAAVREQRLAVLALRSAPAPALPSGLVDRLRGLPGTTPLHAPSTTVAPDGSLMLSTMAPTAALVPITRPASARHGHRIRPLATTAALLAVAGVLTSGAVLAEPNAPAPGNGTTLRDVAPSTTTVPISPELTFGTVTLLRPGGR
ncbi:MAG: hypothetical protein ABI345_05000 [Jatrophihabitans sp.]